jgi:hypothetical protein
LFFSGEFCPSGIQSELRNFPDRFDLDTPNGVNPNDVLSGRPVFLRRNQKLTYGINIPVFLMDLQYTSSSPTMVVLMFADKPTETRTVSW